MAESGTEYSLIEQLLTLLDSSSQTDSATARTALQLKKFIDEIPGGFLMYRADDREDILYANKALLRIFRCDTLAEFKAHTGNSFKGLVHPDDLAAVEKSIAEQIERSSDELDYVEYRIIRKDGKIRRVEDYGRTVHTEFGNIYYVFISDATEKINRRLTEKTALKNENREMEQQLQSLISQYDKERKLIRKEELQRLEVIEGLSANYESILYADIDSDKVRPYRLSSRLERQFEKKYQTLSFRAVVRDYAEVWVHPEDRASVLALTQPDYIRKRLAENATYYMNYRCIQNGEVKYLQLRLVNVSNNAHISQIVMGYRNIDEEIMQEMKQKQILQDALRNAQLAQVAKNTFLSNMSHDMRTPLNAVFGYAALAEKSLRENTENAEKNEQILQYIKKIETAGNQILDLVNRVLELSYMESQDFAVTEEPCDIAEVLQSVCKALHGQAVEKNVLVATDTSGMEHGFVYADRDKLIQILTQLVSNGVKYTPSGGNVTLSVAEQIKPASEFAAYRFTVRDTGIGIAADYLPRIFDPFEREKNTTFSGVFGTGLGLTIAKHLAEIMGGSITAESKQGQGSTFTVTLTLRTQTAATKPAEKPVENTDFHGKKILLVEDNEINLEIETELLQDIGFIVDTAENGKIAVEKIRASKPGEYMLVLMDIQMPVMDGNSAAQAIRKLENPALARIPILALSANAFESDKRASMESGMDAHLTKPIDLILLAKTIAETIRH